MYKATVLSQATVLAILVHISEGKIMKTIYNTNWFLNRIKETHEEDYSDYELKSEYINNHTKVIFFHKPCGKEIAITPASFMRGRGCVSCGRKRSAKKERKTTAQAQKELPSYIHIIGDYHGALESITVHCDRCNETYKTTYHNFSKHYYCTHCNGNARESTERFSREVDRETDSEYSLIGEYTKANDYVTIKHNLCGHTYKVTPHNFKHGKRCPRCNSSHGESKIISILKKLDIEFEYPKKFDDLKNTNCLHYDFFLPKYQTLIEYQGEQHYHPVKHFGGKEKFKKQVLHDNIKRSYASNHGYKLLEIPYTVYSKDDIETYIKGFIQ